MQFYKFLFLFLFALNQNIFSAAESTAAAAERQSQTFPTFEIDGIQVPYVPFPDDLKGLVPFGKENETLLTAAQTAFFPVKDIQTYYPTVDFALSVLPGPELQKIINQPVGYRLKQEGQRVIINSGGWYNTPKLDDFNTYQLTCEFKLRASSLPLHIALRMIFDRLNPCSTKCEQLDRELNGVRQLLETGANPNLLQEPLSKAGEVRTALGYVCFEATYSEYFLDLVKLLLKHKANPHLGIFNYFCMNSDLPRDQRTIKHMPPLALLAEKDGPNHHQIKKAMALLIAYGASKGDIVSFCPNVLNYERLLEYQKTVNNPSFDALVQEALDELH